MGAPTVSVVVPTRNERENVGLVVERVVAALDGVEVEICFVDDSTDDTPAVLAGLVAERPGAVRFLHREGEARAGGLSTAVIAGLRMATGRYVCVMDADLQHPPETIADMLAAANAGGDLVVASRYVPGGSTQGLDGAVRRLVSRAATRLAHLLFREARRSADPLSGFFLCRRSLVDGVEFRPVGFKILLELLVLLPDIDVRDVPMVFGERAHGASKASVGQGLQYLRHLVSLVLDVRGSARTWKFGLVGLSGLGVFLPLLWLLSGPAGLADIPAFAPAFAVSLTWNTVVNRLWTFADLRQRGADRGVRGYLGKALLSGGVMFTVYALLVSIGWLAVGAGAVAALAAMLLNGLLNRPAPRTTRFDWVRIAADTGVIATLDRLAERIGADRAYVAPVGSSVESDLVDRATRSRQAILVVEAPSYRPQRRTNIEAVSRLVVPVVHEDAVVAAVVA
ncbi:MAG TPA: glycosyltransferase family 2 protein, partial [Candidatus Dormibacteraeota bacterium]|nr:glycosyltransferase family 2 protein [Candidatus Dormibacteraeota bacterium]